MTIQKFALSSITYASEDTGPDAPCVFVWADGRTETHPKSWTGFFRGVEGGRRDGVEYEWDDGTGMAATQTVAQAFGGSIGAYAPPPPPDPPPE